jgi:hypothetical protein
VRNRRARPEIHDRAASIEGRTGRVKLETDNALWKTRRGSGGPFAQPVSAGIEVAPILPRASHIASCQARALVEMDVESLTYLRRSRPDQQSVSAGGAFNTPRLSAPPRQCCGRRVPRFSASVIPSLHTQLGLRFEFWHAASFHPKGAHKSALVHFRPQLALCPPNSAKCSRSSAWRRRIKTRSALLSIQLFERAISGFNIPAGWVRLANSESAGAAERLSTSPFQFGRSIRLKRVPVRVWS